MTCPTCGRRRQASRIADHCEEPDGIDCLRAALAARDAELATAREQLAALRRAWPTEWRHVDASPDAEYPVRILKSYIDETVCVGRGGPSAAELAKVMNQAQTERNAILRRALAAMAAARRGAAQPPGDYRRNCPTCPPTISYSCEPGARWKCDGCGRDVDTRPRATRGEEQ